MSLKHVSRMGAAGALSAALAVGGLALTTHSAGAAPAKAAASAKAAAAATSYSCNFGAHGTKTVPVSYAMPYLPETALAGVPIPQQQLTTTLTLPAGLAGALVGPGGTIKGTVDGLRVTFGFAELPVSMTSPATTVVGSADAATLVLGGFLGGMNPGYAGPLPIAFPSSFDLTLQKGKGTNIGTYTCSQAAPIAGGTVQVVLQTSSMKGKLVTKKVTPNKPAKVDVTVTRQVGEIKGRVTATLNGKKIGGAKLRHGHAVLQLQKLGVGVWKVKVEYGGDPATKAAEKTITVRVTR